ncbi:MAG TPA: adenylate/guanylate cyclase domain-containing protein [Gammaproteobacteria bacterium]|nr:adenylate/guanylate cyclase domain-containing protein [Gammaproteobacteria bacterium]
MRPGDSPWRIWQRTVASAMTAVITLKLGGEIKKMSCDKALTFGRDKNNDVVLNDLHVSRNHAIIRCVGQGDYYLIDSGSSNGSYVNKKRIAAPRLLRNGDCISIGRTQILFTQDAKVTRNSNTVSLQDTLISDTPEIKQITILVADIRGFTSLSEQVNIRTLTKLMNSWFHQVSNAIFNNGGVVDKFIGDCVFACWESEVDQKKTVVQALTAAYHINRITRELDRTYAEVSEQVRIGVGINTGAASLGIGQDNTALGDAVNVAFRLESATKVLGTDVVMSETAYRHLPEELLQGKKQHIKVKGKRDTVRIVCLDFDEVEAALKYIHEREQLAPLPGISSLQTS